MRPRLDYRLMIGLGFVLVVLGVVLPWLMVMRIIQPTWFLSFLSFTASMAGIILGITGSVSYVRLRHR